MFVESVDLLSPHINVSVRFLFICQTLSSFRKANSKIKWEELLLWASWSRPNRPGTQLWGLCVVCEHCAVIRFSYSIFWRTLVHARFGKKDKNSFFSSAPLWSFSSWIHLKKPLSCPSSFRWFAAVCVRYHSRLQGAIEALMWRAVCVNADFNFWFHCVFLFVVFYWDLPSSMFALVWRFTTRTFLSVFKVYTF